MKTLLAAVRPVSVPHHEAVRDDPERGDVPGWVMVTLVRCSEVFGVWVTTRGEGVPFQVVGGS